MKQSLAARFLFRAVVLAFLVYAMLLTWWTPFTGDSFMHSVFGADHRLAFQPVLERCWWSYMHWNPRLGEFLAILQLRRENGFFWPSIPSCFFPWR